MAVPPCAEPGGAAAPLAAEPPERCDCGASLTHVAGDGVHAVLCPECDRDRLDELLDDDGHVEEPRRLDLNAQLAELGHESAREAWHEHGGELASLPRCPGYRAWAALACALCLLDNDQRLTDTERRVFEHAYRNELHALAVANELNSVRARAVAP